MKSIALHRRVAACWQFLAVLSLAGIAATSAHAKPAVFTWTDNDSDITGVAAYPDPVLTNPWGLTSGTAGNAHVADNVSGYSTVYSPEGVSYTGTTPITIPSVSGTEPGSPTGIDEDYYGIFNPGATDDFPITHNTTTVPSQYIYCTEDGAIEGWSRLLESGATAFITYSSTSAGYTGSALTWATTGSGSTITTGTVMLHHRLYAANFAEGQVDVFDSSFNKETLLSGTAFQVPLADVPVVTSTTAGAAWSPFNIHRLDFKNGSTTVRRLVVLYALHTPASLNDIPGDGNGFAALFTPEGEFQSVLIAPSGTDAGGAPWSLNSPWGMAVAHSGYAGFPKITILIGNHGSGKINAFEFDPAVSVTHAIHQETLQDVEGNPLQFSYLWALHFAAVQLPAHEDAAALVTYEKNPSDLDEDTTHLFFSAGIVEENRGLIGTIERK